MSDKKNIVEELVDAIAQLSQANRLTGIWDNRRFQESKKDIDSADLKFIYKTEKLSRKNVELRAVHRTRIDVALDDFVAEYSKTHRK